MLSLGVLVWWFLGYGFANSKVVDFIGKWNFAGDEWKDKDHYLWATWQGFVGVYITLVIGGALTERLQLSVYMWYTGFVMAFVWPVVCAWAWGGGWLSDHFDNGFVDNGGACTIHVFAGAFLLPALFLTSRRSEKVQGAYFKPDEINFFMLGIFLEMIGLLYIINDYSYGIKYVGIGFFNCLLAGGTSAFIAFILALIQNRDTTNHIISSFKAIIAGFVIVASIAQNIHPWEAFVFGIFAGLLFTGVRILEERFNIDDATLVLPAHYIPGLFGTIGVGFWDHDTGVYHDHNGKQIYVQIVGFLCMTVWAAIFGALIFGVKRVALGLRFPKEVEDVGLDKAEYSFIKGFAVKAQQ